MIYEDPVFLIGGDSFVTLELGNDGSLFLNLYILALEKMMREAEFPWLIDTTAMRTTIMIQYDPLRIKADGLIAGVRDLISDGVSVPEKVPSKLIHLPVYYNDPLTRECAGAFDMAPNLEIIAEENNMSIEEVIRIHSHPIYFVSYTCFTYGSLGAFPMDPSSVLKNSKYKVPRKETPPGTLGIGGTTTVLYPISSPGGLMMLGNSPVKTVDVESRNRLIEEDKLLVHPGDTLHFFPIEGKEYDYIKKHVDDYEYEIEQTFIGRRKHAGLQSS